MIKLATVCSGIGAPEIGLKELCEELNLPYEIVFACEYDKYARSSYTSIHGEHTIYPDMTAELWDKPEQKSDVVVGGIPCQAFSLAGKRLGELDPRGLLFFDFYRYVKNQQPKVFIIENVKGLLSDNKGKTFQNWLLLLGNSVNGHSQMFNHPDSLGYNLHHTVLNSKNFGVPQNRERVFIVGIRKDLPNNFRFPIGWKLDKRLKDVLETEVDEKFYLSERILNGFLNKTPEWVKSFKPHNEDEISDCITARYSKMAITDPFIIVKGEVTPNSQGGKIYGIEGLSPTLSAGTHGYAQGYIEEPYCVAMRGRNPENPNDRTIGATTEQRLEPNSQGTTNTITSVQKDNLIVEPVQLGKSKQFAETSQLIGLEIQPAYCIRATESNGVRVNKSRIRRLTPLECWRLQAFPEEAFYKAKAVNSDTQLYKQAGNSMTTTVLKEIFRNLIGIL